MQLSLIGAGRQSDGSAFMSTIDVFTCECGQQMRVKAQHLGLSGKCKGCGKRITVTLEMVTTVEEQAEVSQQNQILPKDRCESCGKLYPSDRSLNPDDNQYLCPTCGFSCCFTCGAGLYREKVLCKHCESDMESV